MRPLTLQAFIVHAPCTKPTYKIHQGPSSLLLVFVDYLPLTKSLFQYGQLKQDSLKNCVKVFNIMCHIHYIIIKYLLSSFKSLLTSYAAVSPCLPKPVIIWELLDCTLWGVMESNHPRPKPPVLQTGLLPLQYNSPRF